MVGVAEVEQRLKVLVHQMRFVQRQDVPVENGKSDYKLFTAPHEYGI